MKHIFWKQEWLYVLIAFLLPLLFFFQIFTTRSFGFDCAPGVMGDKPPYGQLLKAPNYICNSLPDPGGYTWEYPPYWAELSRQYLSGHLPTWTQNVGIGIPFAADFHLSAYFLPLLPFIFLFKLTGNNLFWIDLFFVFRYCVLAAGMFLFLRSMGLSRRVSYVGSLAFFSSGYFIVVPNMAYQNVNIMLPWIGYGINSFFANRRTRWIGVTSLFLGLSMLGGMPESSIFVLFFMAIYILFLSFDKNKFDMKFLLYGGGIIGLGILISSIIYIPGLEFVRNSTSIHHDGHFVGKSLSWEHIIPFIFPKIFITPITRDQLIAAGKLPVDFQIWNYVGSILAFLYVTSLAFLITNFREIKKEKLLQYLCFFLGLSIIMLFQLWGFVHNPVFEMVPVFKETTFPKFASVLIDMSIVTCGCLFIELACRKKTYSPLFGLSVMVGFSLFISFYWSSIFDLLKVYYKIPFINTNILFGLLWCAIVTVVIILPKNKAFIPVLIFLVLCSEIYYNFPKGGEMMRHDSLKSPPAVKYLQEHGAGNEYRILGLEHILYPNLSTTYDLNDMRILEALFQYRQFVFMKEFFAEPEALRITGIKEIGARENANVVTNPFFDLLSVKYLLSYSDLDMSIYNKADLIQQIVKNTPPSPRIRFDSVAIGSNTKDILFAHAPSTITFTVLKPKKARYFTLYPILLPQVFKLKQGDGVHFTVNAYSGDTLLFRQERTLNPHNDADNIWKPLVAGPFSNDESVPVTFELSTDTGNTETYDWSAWAGFLWDNEQKEISSKYSKVYEKEMKVFENKTAIPRIHFVSQTYCAQPVNNNDFSKIITLMKRHASDIRNAAIVEKNDCHEEQFDQGAIIQSQSYNDEDIHIVYSSETAQYGVIQDAYYPGWNVYINGKKGNIDPVNIAFRGIDLPAGRNIKVELRYEPDSALIGLLITLISSILAVELIRRNSQI